MTQSRKQSQDIESLVEIKINKKKSDKQYNLLTTKEIASFDYSIVQEKIVKYMEVKTGSEGKMFFRLLVSYYLGTMAASMRCSVLTPDRGKIPVNIYAMNFAPSGLGKGYSTYIMRNMIMKKFVRKYMKDTFPDIIASKLQKEAVKLSLKNGTAEEIEYAKLMEIFNELGEALFSFDAATVPATKQYRNKLLMGKTGSINFIVDEMGSTLGEHTQILTTMLEMYDMGLVGDKLIKETKDSKRVPTKFGCTPANLLMYGTPVKVFDGAKQEQTFRDLISIGMARRCFFGYTSVDVDSIEKDPEKIFKIQTSDNNEKFIKRAIKYFGTLANPVFHGVNIRVPKKVAILIIRYEIMNKIRASQLPANKEDLQTHYLHAHMRVLKLAGIYCFTDKQSIMQMRHAEAAIKICEDSNRVFKNQVISQEHNFIRLAKYLGETNTKFTHAQLISELAYYPTTKLAREEMLNLAIAYGYTNNISIKITNMGSIQFIKGSKLHRTDPRKMIMAYSEGSNTDQYRNIHIALKNIPEFLSRQGWNFTNHHLKDNYRHSKKVIKGFNFVVLDIDSKVHIETVKIVLREYAYLLYTTKRHTKKKPRFRIVLPLSHEVKLNESDFASFMKILYRWLPFDSDTGTNQRSRKWLTNKGDVTYNEGDFINALEFMPKTTRASNIIKHQKKYATMEPLERWFTNNIVEGNRSNSLIRYAFVLVDSGLGFKEVRSKIKSFNQSLGTLALSNDEINATVLKTTKERIKMRDAK